MTRRLRIALVGGGIGGLSAALALARHGFESHVFEQAGELKEIGAGVAMAPNAVKVLRALGVEADLMARGFEPEAIVGRDWTTACVLFRVPLREKAAARFGAPLVHMHRADLLDILSVAAGLGDRLHLDSRCKSVSSSDRGAVVELSNGKRHEFDLVVGCDGIRSSVRAALHGADSPRFTGNMCWRALVPVDRIPVDRVPPCATIWTGPGGHVVVFYVRGGSLVNVVAVRETAHWVEESWSVMGDACELVAAYGAVHPDLRVLLEQAEHCFKWGLFDRDPLAAWSRGRVTLLGDAAHPMLPFLGQGAAMAIEDGYVLARELARSPDDLAAALRAYEAERVPRTTMVQLAARRQAGIFHMTSRLWGLKRLFRKWTGRFDPDKSPDLKTEWLYTYDPTREPA
jgi:salicylate hydroxylase